MKLLQHKLLLRMGLPFLLIFCLALSGCTKYEKGFLSPYFQYPISLYTVPKGRLFNSDAINPDGSSVPFKIKLVHIYDASGNIVDDMFAKTYPVTVWTSSYNILSDTTYDLIVSKRKIEQLPPVQVNESNGEIVANQATRFLPSGLYSMDLQVSNVVGNQTLKKIVSFKLADAPPFETAPTLGSVYDRLFKVGNESVVKSAKNPSFSVTRVADSPNLVIFKLLDKNGVPFNPKKGEIVKRPNSGLNPNPPFLQNFQDYTHSYIATDTAMVFPFAFTPMPYISLGNGYNLYYRIPTQFVHINGFPDDTYSCNPRIPVRIWQPGTYNITMQFPDLTHR
jgi:hypothetical protein